MLKTYRKNFVVFTMAVIGVILAAVFVFIGVYMYRQTRSELRSTMQQVLRPLDEPTGMFRRIGEAREKPDGGFGDGEPGEGKFGDGEPGDGERPDGAPPEDEAPPREQSELSGDAQIITVFYTPESGEISVQSEDAGINEDEIAAAVAEIAAAEDSYGTLDSYGLIYMREGIGGTYKIALAETSYVTGRVARTVGLLALIYVAAMGALLLLTIHLAKRAAKPMENAIEMERQFVTDISHDLKTPITVILANNSILAQNAEATVGSQSQWIESTDDAAHGMMELITRMLTMSALDARDKASEELYAVDLSSACEKAVLQMESVAFDRNISLESEIAPDVTVTATKEYAERIVGALVENALKYEGEGGRVDVTLTADKRRATLTVHNASSYIDEADIEHVFERFYRADRSRSEKSGHGLGLPIVKRQAELIGATVGVGSTREDGTTFTVVFTLANA